MSISVSSTSSSSGSTQTQTTSSASFADMDASDFMNLLMAQLTHQNPMEPMDDTDMMNQFSQLNSLSQLQSISSLLTQSTAINQTAYATSLIGKTVKVAVDTDTTVEGVVSSVSAEDGVMMIKVDDETYPLSDVIEIEGTE